MSVELCKGRQLPEEWRVQWSRLVAGVARWRSPFWRPELISAFAMTRPQIEVARLTDAGGTPFGFFPFERRGQTAVPAGDLFNDFHGLVCDRGLRLDEIRLMLTECGLSGYRFHHMPNDQAGFERSVDFAEASRSIDLSLGYAAYEADLRRQGSQVLRRMGQRMRKMGREIGPLELRESRQTADLTQLAQWKREACRVKGWTNLYDRPGTSAIYAELLAREDRELRGRLFLLNAGEQAAA